MAAISDGEMVVKVTLFEEFASKVQQELSCIIRGNELGGKGPPCAIHISAHTQFFKDSALPVSEELFSK